MNISRCAILCFVALFLTFCKSQEKSFEKPAIEMRVVYSPELTPLMSKLKKLLEASSASFPKKISLDLIPENSVSVSEKIASGTLKTDIWLVTSKALAKHTNTKIINLGAAQKDCKEVFLSPVVFATQEEFLPYFYHKNLNFSWADFSENARLLTAGESDRFGIPSYITGTVDQTTSGFAALLQLIYFASEPQKTKNIQVENLKTADFKHKFQSVLNRLSYYAPQEAQILNRAAITRSHLVFSLTSEQQLISHNKSNPNAAKKLFALYPEEGVVWMDYSVCLSDADWVIAEKQAAYREFIRFMSSQEVGEILVSEGFRLPETSAFKSDYNLFAEHGALPAGPIAESVQVGPEVIDYVFANKEKLQKPYAAVYILDISGSTTGSILAAGKRMMRALLAHSKPNNLSALMTYSDKVEVRADFSNEHSSKIKILDSVEASGASSVYDALAEAIKMLTRRDLGNYIKYIYFFTDGNDNASQMSLIALMELIRDTRRYYEINVEIVALELPGVDYTDIERLAQAFNGNYYKTDLDNIDRVITGLVSNF